MGAITWDTKLKKQIYIYIYKWKCVVTACVYVLRTLSLSGRPGGSHRRQGTTGFAEYVIKVKQEDKVDRRGRPNLRWRDSVKRYRKGR